MKDNEEHDTAVRPATLTRGFRGASNLTTSDHDGHTPDRPALVAELFDRVVDMTSAEQAAFLDRHCAHLPDVRHEVEVLLRSDDNSSSGLLPPKAGDGLEPLKLDTSVLDRGTLLGNYRVVGVLDEGGMGVVYEARHVELERTAVIKMLRSRYNDDPEAITRFRHEAHVLGRLRHPSIVDIYHVGVHTDGHVYIVLERLPGESLEKRLEHTPSLDPHRALAFTRQVARTLAAVHAEGIIHRDLKPANLFVVPDPEVASGERIKILDFGIAKLNEAGEMDRAHQTVANAAMGTPAFMSPEQWTDARQADARTDLYALGVILFRMLSGRLPFVRPNLLGYMHAHTHEQVPRLEEVTSSLPPHIARQLGDVVARLMAKKPDDRFPCAEALIFALDVADLRPGSKPTLPGVSPPAKDWRDEPVYASPVWAQATSAPVGPLWCVPDLPPHFLPRPDDMAALVEALTAPNRDRTVGITSTDKHGVHGMGGIGKTVLAVAVARNDKIRARFVDGVYWLSVGQTPQLLSLQAQLGKALGLTDTAFDSPTDGQRELAVHLADKSALLVLDDVWDAEHAAYLEVAGTSGRILLTTRNLDVLTWRNTSAHSLDVPTVAQACTLLADWSGTGLDDLEDEKREAIESVAQACGRLPLALAMIGALVRLRTVTWSRALEWLQGARLDRLKGKIPAYPYRNVYQAIEVSVRALELDDTIGHRHAGACYTDLAVFREDEPIPRGALCVLWARHGLDADDVDILAGALAARALASKQDNANGWTLTLHDLQRSFVRACAAELAGLHAAFIDAYQERCEHGSARGPTMASATPGERLYYFMNVPHHLVEAGRGAELRDLLWSYSWLDSKLRLVGVDALLSDFELIPCERPLSLIRDALRLSSHVLERDVDQLPVQLIGRLGYFEQPDADESQVRTFLELVRARVDRPWLCPVVPRLTPPGGPLLRTFDDHRGTAGRAFALSADGAQALSYSAEHGVTLWDTQTGRMLCVFEGKEELGTVNVVALSADGTRALGGSKNGVVALWNTHDGRLLWACAEHAAWVTAVALSADNTCVLSCSMDQTLKLWDGQSGQVLHTFKTSAAIMTADLSADGTRALAGTLTGALDMWDAQARCRHLTRIASPGRGITSVALSADGKRALSSSHKHTFDLWNMDTGELLHTFDEHRAPVTTVVSSAVDGRALSGSLDRTLKLWDTKTRQLLYTFEGHTAPIRAVALSADGTRALSGSEDNTLRFWDLSVSALIQRVKGHSDSVRSVALNNDGTRALSVSADRTLKLWDTRDGRLLLTFGDGTPLTYLAINASGSLALTAFDHGMLLLWDVASGRIVRTFESHMDWIQDVALNASGTLVMAVSDIGVLVWNAQNGMLLRSFRHLYQVSSAVLDADREYAFMVLGNRKLELWDTRSNNPVSILGERASDVRVMAMSADGTYAFSTTQDNKIEVWDIRTGSVLRTLAGHQARVRALTSSVTGRYALSGSDDCTLVLWDTKSGQPVHKFHTEWAVRSVALAVTGDGLVVVAGDQSGHVHILHQMSGL